MKFTSDIDLDLADREHLLRHLSVVPAAIRKNGTVKKHNTGVYPMNIPYDPVHDVCALDYRESEARGYTKLDLLNVWVYKHVQNEVHLIELMREPDWKLLHDRDYFRKLIHIGNHYDRMLSMPEPIDTVPRLAMFLSIIRPAKKHLIGLPWSEVAKTVWDISDDGYSFKKAHGVAYANLVVVNMNLLADNPTAFSLQE